MAFDKIKRKANTSDSLLKIFNSISIDEVTNKDIRKYFKYKQIKEIIELSQKADKNLQLANLCPPNTPLYDVYIDFSTFKEQNQYHRAPGTIIPLTLIMAVVSFLLCKKNIRINNNGQIDYLSLWFILLAGQSSLKTIFSNRALKPIKDKIPTLSKLKSGASLIDSFKEAKESNNETLFQYIDEIGDYFMGFLNMKDTNFQEIKEYELISYSNDSITRRTKKDGETIIETPKLIKYNFGTPYKFFKTLNIDSFYDGYFRRHLYVIADNDIQEEDQRWDKIEKDNINFWDTFEYDFKQMFTNYDKSIQELVNRIENLENDSLINLPEETKKYINQMMKAVIPAIEREHIAFYHTMLFMVYKLSAIYQVIIDEKKDCISLDAAKYAVQWVVFFNSGLQMLFNNLSNDMSYNELWDVIDTYYNEMKKSKAKITEAGLVRELIRKRQKLFSDLNKTKQLVNLYFKNIDSANNHSNDDDDDPFKIPEMKRSTF